MHFKKHVLVVFLNLNTNTCRHNWKLNAPVKNFWILLHSLQETILSCYLMFLRVYMVWETLTLSTCASYSLFIKIFHQLLSKNITTIFCFLNYLRNFDILISTANQQQAWTCEWEKKKMTYFRSLWKIQAILCYAEIQIFSILTLRKKVVMLFDS